MNDVGQIIIILSIRRS